MMKLLLVLFFVGCIDNNNQTAELTTCSGPDCFTVIAHDSAYSALRPDGQPWDPDGSLPDPYAIIRLNGIEIGRTAISSRVGAFSNGSGILARWDEVVGAVYLHDGDQLIADTLDDLGYLVHRCLFVVRSQVLITGSVNIGPCQLDGQEEGSFSFGFQ
jgi:hypothetical protein